LELHTVPNIKEVLYTAAIAALAVAVVTRVDFLKSLVFPAAAAK
jgi:hypothetical protein